MPKGFSDSEKELIRKRLLDHGYRLFSTYGLQKTNVEEIARAAGISKGAFYIFYQSKEELFMSVVEQMESRLRQGILASIDQPGPSPRARLYSLFKGAFGMIKSMPIMQFLDRADFDLVLRRLPPGKFQSHMVADIGFLEVLLERCRSAGIPIRVSAHQVVPLLYPLALAMLRQTDLEQGGFSSGLDQLLELAAAYCLGEVELILQPPAVLIDERESK